MPTEPQKGYKEKNVRKNLLRMFVLSLGGWHCGFYVTCMNALSKPIIGGVFGYDETNTSQDTLNTINGMVNFVYAVGALLSTLVTGELSERFGRRSMLYAGDIIALLMILPSCFAHLAPFLVGRFLQGIAAGIILSIYNIWFFELLPKRIIGIGSPLGYFFLLVGINFSYLCQNIWDYQDLVDYWRIFICYPQVVSVVRLCLYPFLFKTDTPVFIYEKLIKEKYHPLPVKTEPDDYEDEKPPSIPSERQKIEVINVPHSPFVIMSPQPKQLSIHDLHHLTPDEEILEMKGVNRIKKAYAFIYDKEDLNKVVVENVKFWKLEMSNGASKVLFKELFTSKYWKQLLISCFIAFAHQISGINFFGFYSTLLFDKIAGNGKTMTMVLGFINFGGCFISLVTTNRLGRKPNLIVGTFAASIGWAFFLAGYQLLSIPLLYVSVVVYILGFSLGLGSLQALYPCEVLPPVGVGLAMGIMWGFTAITGLVFPFLIDSVGPVGMSGFFLIFCLFTTFYIWATAVETKDKTAEAIFEEFHGSFLHFCKKKTA